MKRCTRWGSEIEHEHGRARARDAAADDRVARALGLAEAVVAMLGLARHDVDHAGAADAFAARRIDLDADRRERLDDREVLLDAHGLARAGDLHVERVERGARSEEHTS